MYYKDNKLANDQSAESDWQRRGLYIGPQFSELDEVYNFTNIYLLFTKTFNLEPSTTL